MGPFLWVEFYERITSRSRVVSSLRKVPWLTKRYSRLKMNVLILTEQTSNDRKTLAAVRSLASQGHRVSVASDTKLSAALWSRHTFRRISCPSPILQSDAYVAWLVKEVSTSTPDFLLPVSDYTTMLVAEHAKTLSTSTRFSVPPIESFHQAHDKFELMNLADTLGVLTPTSYCPSNRKELLAIARDFTYPAVFKLRKGAGAIGLGFPGDAETLIRQYDALGSYSDDIYDAERPLVQQFIPGPIHDVCALFDRGKPVVTLTQTRQLMHPARGGVGIYNRTTNEPTIRAQAIALLSALQWHGPAMVEFKQDSRDEKFKLIEINPRLWGTLDLSIQSGVDFPNLLANLATSDTPSPSSEYRVDECYRWPLPYVFKRSIPPRPWRDTWTLLRPDFKSHSEFYLTDPLPEVAKLTDVLYRSWHKLRSGDAYNRTLKEKVVNG